MAKPDNELTPMKRQYNQIKDQNLVFLVDTSGSMYDADKLPLAVDALKYLLQQMDEQDEITGKMLLQRQEKGMLVQNPPMPPLEREELDAVYALPYTRRYHPSYDAVGGVPAITEVEMSVTHNRGCFGACNFCAIAFHQGRTVRSRSIESVVELIVQPGEASVCP